MASNVTDRDLGLKAFIRQLEVARTVEVAVGIHAGSTAHGQQIAEYAACNEYGTDSIPERSFMRSSFDENLIKIQNDMNQQAGLVIAGQSTVRRALGVIGMKHQDRVKRKIGSSIQPANHPETIKRKKSSRTLIDTGAMLNSVHYVIRAKS